MRTRAERRYNRLLSRILGKVEEAIKGIDDPAQIKKAILALQRSRLFDEWSREAAQQMATMLAVGQKSTWRAAAASSSMGRTIYEALRRETTNSAIGQTIQEIVLENSKLIKTVPRNMAEKLSQLSEVRWKEGLRPEQITREVMQEAKHLREFEARRIARTESSKASTALTQARAESLHLDFYIWRTARDGDRVRESHQIMESVICRWSDPPNPETLAGEKSRGPYHPGCIYNCRCIAIVIVSLNDIKFPCKCHKNGRIYSIGSMKAFKELYNLA